MPQPGTALGATRGGHKDPTNPGRGVRSRGHGGSKVQSNRGAARVRGGSQARLGRPTTSDAGSYNVKESVSGISAANSPFAPIKMDNTTGFRSVTSPSLDGSQGSLFGKPSPTSGNIASKGFGAPSTAHQPMGNSVQAARDPRLMAASQKRLLKGQTAELNSASGAAVTDYQERYEKLKLDRVKQREMAIRQGQMADPNQPTLLNKAITPVGTCISMCPEFERVERIVQKMVDKSEKSLDSATGSYDVRELKMLKRFRRSAAGYDEQLPSDIRTPNTLLQTMNYLIRHIVSGPEPLGLIHKFVWDRTRSIRNDFSVQQLTNTEDIKIAVKCLERIARFHIVSLHLLSSPDNEEQFDHHQEREQLNNTMLSLMHYYDDNRERMNFPNEPEFRAYYVVLAIHDQRPDIEDRVQNWPQEILRNPKVQTALELLAAANNYWEYQIVLDEMRPTAISQGFYNRFFSLVDSSSVSYLMGCVAEIYFNNVRQTAIRSIWKAYCRVPISQQHKNEEWTLDELTRVLYFDDESQAEEFCEEQGLQLMKRSDGALYLNWGTSNIDIVDFAPSSQHSFSESYVEAKRGGRTLAAIILGMNIKQAATRGMIDTSIIPISDNNASLEEDDNELFVRQDNELQHQEAQTPFQNSSQMLHQSSNANATRLATVSGPFGVSQSPMVPVETTQLPPIINSSPWAAPTKPSFAPSFLSTASTSTSAPPSLSQPFSQNSSSSAGPSPHSLPTISSNAPNPLSSWPAPSQNPFATTVTSGATAPTERSKSPFSWPPPPQSSQSSSAVFEGSTASNPTIESKPLFMSHLPPSDQNTTSGVSSSTPSAEPSKPLFSWPSNGQISDCISKATDLPAATMSPEPPSMSLSAGSPFQLPTLKTPISNTCTTVSESIFSKSPPAQKPPVTFTSPAPAVFGKPSISGQAVQSDSALEAEDTSASQTRVISQAPSPLVSNKNADINSNVDGTTVPTSVESALQLEPDQSVKVNSNADSDASNSEALSRSENSVDDSADFRKSWIETLRQSAMDNRSSQANKKRPLEAETQTEQTPHLRGNKKAPANKSRHEEGIVKPKRTPRKQKKTSLALASIAPLPTLPILEQVKKFTHIQRTPEAETVSSRTSQVDEDEMLLSAARIAAEQLKNGPRLIEKVPDYSYSDHFRSSTSFSRSLNSDSHMPTLSSSPYVRINGYDVALAPDTPLGLGRTLSRTEQRLRITGGKGLAYKPIQLTPEKEMSNRRSDKKKIDRNLEF